MNSDDPHPLLSKNRANPVKTAPKQSVAAALQNDPASPDLPRIVAAGKGALAEQILDLAFKNGVKVRQDPVLAEMLAMVEVDSPIPPEALAAVAEILAYVYEAEGKARPDADDPFRLPY